MNTIQLRLVPIAMLICTAISGCNPGTGKLPAVSEENCTAVSISKIGDESSRKEFAGLCARRNTFKPSAKKGW